MSRHGHGRNPKRTRARRRGYRGTTVTHPLDDEPRAPVTRPPGRRLRTALVRALVLVALGVGVLTFTVALLGAFGIDLRGRPRIPAGELLIGPVVTLMASQVLLLMVRHPTLLDPRLRYLARAAGQLMGLAAACLLMVLGLLALRGI